MLRVISHVADRLEATGRGNRPRTQERVPMKIAAAFAFLLVLCACATPEELAAENVAEDHAACTSYGFQQGTDPYRNCRMELDQRRKADLEATRRRMLYGIPY
jgi:hypothetical protein